MNCCHTYPTETGFWVDLNRAYVFTVRACDTPYHQPTVCSAYESGTFQTYPPRTDPPPSIFPAGTITWDSADIQASTSKSANLAHAVGVTVDAAGKTAVLLGR